MITCYRIHIDGFGCESKCLGECAEFVTVLVNTLKVREVMRQQIEISDNIPDAEPGISTQVTFLESSLSLHTWPVQEQASLDIFSCKAFGRNMVENAFTRFFKPSRIEIG